MVVTFFVVVVTGFAVVVTGLTVVVTGLELVGGDPPQDDPELTTVE